LKKTRGKMSKIHHRNESGSEGNNCPNSLRFIGPGHFFQLNRAFFAAFFVIGLQKFRNCVRDRKTPMPRHPKKARQISGVLFCAFSARKLLDEVGK